MRGLVAIQVEDALDLAHHPLGPLPELLEPLQDLADPIWYPVGRLPVPALEPRGPRRSRRSRRPRAFPVALVVDLAGPVVRVAAGLPAVLFFGFFGFFGLVGSLFGQVGLFLGQVGLFLGTLGLTLGPVGPVLRFLRRGAGLAGPPLRLLLLLLVSPLPGQVGGFGGHIRGVVRHHGRLVRLFGPLPGVFGPFPRLVGSFPGPVRPLPRAQGALVLGGAFRTGPVRGGLILGDAVRGFVAALLALDRVPGHAVGFAGLGHPLAGGDLPGLVLSHDHFFPAGRPASARHG